MKPTHEEHAAAMNTITELMEILGTSDTMSISGQVAALKKQHEALAAENAGLKSTSVKLYNHGYLNGHQSTVEGYFTDIHRNDIDTYHSDVVEEIIDEETLATDRFIADVKAQGVEEFKSFLQSKLSSVQILGCEDAADMYQRMINEFVPYYAFGKQLREAK